MKRKQTTCVAISNDGIAFSRPSLHIYPSKNGDATNIIHYGPTAHNFMVFHGGNQHRERRFMAIGGVDGTTPADSGIYLFGSDDGFHFDLLRDSPILTGKHNRDEYHSYYDSMNTVSWDRFRNTYWIWLRMNTRIDSSYYRRQSQFSQIKDLLEGEPIPLADVSMYDATFAHYVSCISSVPSANAATYFVGIPVSFPLYENSLALSRDGVTFVNPKDNISAYLPDPFLSSRGSPSHRNYIYRQACISGVLPSPDKNRWLFYHLFYRHHYETPRVKGEAVGVIQSFSVPKWGFTSVQAENGYFFTSPIAADSNNLGAEIVLSFAARRVVGRHKDSSSIAFDLHRCFFLNSTSHVIESRSANDYGIKSFRTLEQSIWSSHESTVRGEINVVQEVELIGYPLETLRAVLQREVSDRQPCLTFKISLHNIAFHGFWIF